MININYNNRLFTESWNVAWRKRTSSILSDFSTEFTVIENSYRYWAADPFLYEDNEKKYIFAELFDYVLRRGVLGVCELGDSIKPKWKPIIIEEFHLSYPYILEFRGKKYIIPESSDAKCLLVYEAVSFPYKWKKVKVLRNKVCYADTTIINSKGIALTYETSKSTSPKLLVIDLCNKEISKEVEVISSLKCRPAGKAFEIDSVFYRPVQVSYDFEQGYGKELHCHASWRTDFRRDR